MIIDTHVHPYLVKDSPEECRNEIEKVLKCMKRAEIDKACLTPMVTSSGSSWYFPGRDEVVFSAEFLATVMKNQAGYFYSMLWVNPYHDIGFLKELVMKYILNGPINGIKLWTEMNACDDRLDAFTGFLELNDVPVLFHCFNNTCGRTYFESNPSEIACLAAKRPRLRAIMAHLRGCRYRGIQDIKKFPNVYIDTSGSGAEDGYLEYALEELGPDRILFGTDYPGRDFATQRGRIDTLDVKPEIKNKLFYENAVKFYGGRKR